MLRIVVPKQPALPAEIGRTAWAEMMSDVDLFRPALAAIGPAAGFRIEAEIHAGFPGSCAVFVVDKKVVVKLFPPLFAADFDVERTAYALLQARVQAVPRLLQAGIYQDHLAWPYLVLQYCSGAPIRDLASQLGAREKQVIAGQVGELLRSVQRTAVPEDLAFTPWPLFLEARAHTCLDELRRQAPLGECCLDEIKDFLAAMLPQLGQEATVLLNGDVTADHVLVAGEPGQRQLQAVIDWADALVGPPTYEWVAAWFGFCQRDPAVFRALVEAAVPGQVFDSAFRRQLLACTFLHRFGPLIIGELWQSTPPPQPLTLRTLAGWLWPL